jgi:hypothetical protein
LDALAVAFRRTIRATVAALALAAIVCCAASASLAQQGPLVAQKAEIGRILREKSLADPQKAALFNDYFKLFFRQFINPSPGPNTFPDLRHELRIFRAVGQKGQAYDALTQLSYRYMGAIAISDKYSPAARVNAILILGELNEQEAGKPLSAALRPLLIFATGDSYQGQPIPDELKVAAMVGLERWASLGAIPADKQAALSGAMLALVNQQTPPPGRTAEAQDWMRRQAAQVLAALGSPGPKNEVLAAYETILAASGTRNSLRCEVAKCLGRLKYPEGLQADFPALANLIGHQTVEICQRELDRDQQRPRRALFTYALRSALLGLEGSSGRGGLKAAASGTDAQQLVDAVRAPIDTAYQSAVNEETPDPDVKKAVETMIDELAALLPEKAAPKSDNVAAGDAPPAGQAETSTAARAPSAAGN